MRIAITGAGGFVGAALARRFAARHEVVALTRRELDVTDAGVVRRVVSRERPDVLINCAVVGVDECARDPALARAVNADAARRLAEAAEAAGAEFVQVSTNYVFEGALREGEFYTNGDEARPVNEYGRTKLAGERAARGASSRCHVVRTSWVFGAGKENFVSTAARKLAAGERVRAVADVWASATYVEDLAARVEEIIERRHHATYHVANAGACSYLDFALESARLAGLDEAEARRLVEPLSEDEMKRAARPRRTPMRCLVSENLVLEPLRDWREALADFLRAHPPRP
jgi:dTDP-4-dehydrorhamnose reductase